MNIEKSSISVPATIDVDLEVITLDDDLHVARRSMQTNYKTSKTKINLPQQLKNKVVEEFLVDAKQLNELKNGKIPSVLNLRYIPDDVLEVARLQGFTAAWEEIERQKIWNTSVFDYCLDKNIKDNLVQFKHSSHMLFDRHNTPLPCAVHFDYISNHIDETSHDLVMLAEYLNQREDIFVFGGERKNSPNKGLHEDFRAKSAKDAIFNIPYYNAEEGRNQSVQFIWQPNKEQYQHIWGVLFAQSNVKKDEQYISATFNGEQILSYLGVDQLSRVNQKTKKMKI